MWKHKTKLYGIYSIFLSANEPISSLPEQTRCNECEADVTYSELEYNKI